MADESRKSAGDGKGWLLNRERESVLESMIGG